MSCFSSPSPNILTEFFQAASQTSSTDKLLIPATAYATCTIPTGSFLPLTIMPFSHFSFLTDWGNGGAAARYFIEACEFRISHQGPSVSNCSRLNGIFLTTSMFSSVFMLHPLTPISNPISTSRRISSIVPVKLCTKPLLGREPRRPWSNLSKSVLAARECKKRGSWILIARSSWASKNLSCCSLGQRKSLS